MQQTLNVQDRYAESMAALYGVRKIPMIHETEPAEQDGSSDRQQEAQHVVSTVI